MRTSSEPTVEVEFPAGGSLRVLEHREAQHHFGSWEVGFLRTLFGVLQSGHVVYDVGAECGEFSALMAKRVGPENVHLLEPMPENWAAIKALWRANQIAKPASCWPGFASDESRGQGTVHAWPEASNGDWETDARFGSVSEHTHLPAITLDEYAEKVGRAPDVITIDVEGAEGLVLTGAVGLLRTARPLVFVAIHAPDALWRYRSETVFRFRQWTQELLFRFLIQAEYEPQFIEDDHESHWLMVPRRSRWSAT